MFPVPRPPRGHVGQRRPLGLRRCYYHDVEPPPLHVFWPKDGPSPPAAAPAGFLAFGRQSIPGALTVQMAALPDEVVPPIYPDGLADLIRSRRRRA